MVGRPNRFTALVAIDEAQVAVHVPNTGRLGELLVRGARVWLVPRPSALRRTAWDLALVEAEGTLIGVDSRMANGVVASGLALCSFEPLGSYSTWRREVRLGASRLDFMLQGDDRRCYVEVKNVTLVRDGCALFPDAPTIRGTRHLRELTECVLAGDRAAAVFIILRSDAGRFSPNALADPPFAAALREAAQAGVAVSAYRCEMSLTGVALGAEIPVCL